MKTKLKACFYDQWKPAPDAYDVYMKPEKTAIVVIDMYRSHLDDSDQCPCPCPRGLEILDDVNDFNRKARELGVPVIHVHCKLRKGGQDDRPENGAAWRVTFPQYLGAPIKGLDHYALEGTKWVDIMTEVDPDKDLIVDTKKRLSIFYATDLDFLLRSMKIECLVITGIMSDCCDLCAAFEASNRGYKVIYAENLTRGLNDEMEDCARKLVSTHLGMVVKSDDLIEEWRAIKADA